MDENTSLEKLITGFQSAQIIMTAARLGIFEKLEKPMDLDSLKASLGGDFRALRILCNALCALQLVEKKDDKYCNSAFAAKYLSSTASQPKSGILRHWARLYETWGHLYQIVLSGKPVDGQSFSADLMEDEVCFAKAMADIALPVAAQTAEMLDLSQQRMLLDIGGGPGVYALEFVRKNPQLTVMILDNLKTIEYAKSRLKKSPENQRVVFTPGDAFTASFPDESFDTIFLSNVIHSYSFEENRSLIGICQAWLKRDGLLIVKEFFLNEDGISPCFPAIFAVNMLVQTEKGSCFTIDEVRGWLQHAGLIYESLLTIDEQSRMVLARKPSLSK